MENNRKTLTSRMILLVVLLAFLASAVLSACGRSKMDKRDAKKKNPTKATRDSGNPNRDRSPPPADQPAATPPVETANQTDSGAASTNPSGVTPTIVSLPVVGDRPSFASPTDPQFQNFNVVTSLNGTGGSLNPYVLQDCGGKPHNRDCDTARVEPLPPPAPAPVAEPLPPAPIPAPVVEPEAPVVQRADPPPVDRIDELVVHADTRVEEVQAPPQPAVKQPQPTLGKSQPFYYEQLNVLFVVASSMAKEKRQSIGQSVKSLLSNLKATVVDPVTGSSTVREVKRFNVAVMAGNGVYGRGHFFSESGSQPGLTSNDPVLISEDYLSKGFSREQAINEMSQELQKRFTNLWQDQAPGQGSSLMSSLKFGLEKRMDYMEQFNMILNYQDFGWLVVFITDKVDECFAAGKEQKSFCSGVTTSDLAKRLDAETSVGALTVAVIAPNASSGPERLGLPELLVQINKTNEELGWHHSHTVIEDIASGNYLSMMSKIGNQAATQILQKPFADFSLPPDEIKIDINSIEMDANNVNKQDIAVFVDDQPQVFMKDYVINKHPRDPKKLVVHLNNPKPGTYVRVEYRAVQTNN